MDRLDSARHRLRTKNFITSYLADKLIKNFVRLRKHDSDNSKSANHYDNNPK